jgi:AAA+ ATPase superfamily predicted ATPase
MKFIDREKELSFLESKFREKRSQFIILWGKRRVGKTELVKQFVRNKPHVYFLSESTSEQEQLNRFSKAIGQFFGEPLLETRGFASWEESFEYVKTKNRRFILAIDEFPYLIISNPAITSIFQKAWDEYWHDSRIFLIMLGSSIAMMENEVLGYRSPLYGRRTGQWRVDPMTFASVSGFRKNKSFEDRLSHYSTAGGIPAYWLQFNPNFGFWKNLEHSVLQKGQMLYDEVEFILREELREPRFYFALLQAISLGKRKLSEIVNATGLRQPVANKYLGVLSDLKVVVRELPVTVDKPLKSKKGLYRITEEFFQFWFKFVFTGRGELEMGKTDIVLDRIRQNFNQHLSLVYENVAKEVIWNHMGKFFPFSNVGRWWDKNEEIDIVAINPEVNSILFGEVKWSNQPVGINIFASLKEKAKKVEWGTANRSEHFCLFSKSGFTEAMINQASAEGVALFTQDKVETSLNFS